MGTHELPNREIEFRAWEEDCMVYFDLDGINGSNCVRVIGGKRIGYGGGDFFYSIKKHGRPIMQYTGIKDKNGTRIFEGDIVEHIGRKTREGKRVIEVVKYGRQYGREDCFIGYNLDEGEYEVIGNIFENPDILQS